MQVGPEPPPEQPAVPFGVPEQPACALEEGWP